MSGLRVRPPHLRVIVAVIVVAFGAVGFRGGLWSTPSAEPTVQAFLLAWQQRQYQAAAALTTGNPATVTGSLRAAFLQLDAAAVFLKMGGITQQGRTAHAKFYASVDLGQGGAAWKYQGRFRLRLSGSAWKVVWSPSVIHPALRPGLRLAVVSTMPQRAMLLDSAGAPLQTPSLAYAVGVQPGRLARPGVTAARLGKATGLDPAQLLGWIRAAPRGSFQELVLLRPAQYARLKHRLARVPGLIVQPRQVRLFTSLAPAVVGSVGAETSAVLRNQGIAYLPGATVGLSGLQRASQNKLAGTPTIEVVTETTQGRPVSVLKSWQGRASQAVRTTIDRRVQQAANAAVASLPQSSAVVAVQASTGHVLAVATHAATGAPRIDPLNGRYPPGPAFTIVSTEALIAAGLRVDKARIPCVSVNGVGGKTFHNFLPVPKFRTPPTLSVDFAHACATAFVGPSLRLTGQDLATAASGFGLGSQWQLGLPGFSGTVGTPAGVAGVAAATIGQGSVLVSPLAMALAAGQVDSGAWHAPVLVTDQAQAAQASGRPAVPQGRLATLRKLMRAVVRSGAARQADLPGQRVHGQVGTVPLKVGKHRVWASWFVGFRGGVAFAAVEFGRSRAVSATALAARFLAAAGRV